MSVFSLENFRAEVLQNGLAKSHRFEVQIQAPPGLVPEDARFASLFADGTQLPQTRLNTTQMRMWGSPRQMPHWAEYGGDNITFNFHLDRMYDIKRFFDKWIDKVVNRDTAFVSYYSDYIADISIAQLDENEDIPYMVILKEAYPISVNPVQLDMNSAGLSRLSVTFAYKKWYALGDEPAPPAPPPSIDPTKPKSPPVKEDRKVDYLGQSSPLGGNSENPMSFASNSGFSA
jgi:hypothetical protein